MKRTFGLIHRRSIDKAGFTLIELLIAATLSVVLMLVVTYGLSVIVQANQKGAAKSSIRNNLNRALEFISDDIKTARSVRNTAPTWAWSLGTAGSPQAKLYLEIPLSVVSVDELNETIQINNHEFYDGSAVTFSGNPATLTASGLSSGTVYYVARTNPNDFRLKISNTSTAPTINLNSSASDIIVNRLVIYYLRDNTATWLNPKTINRSTGPCGGSGNPNCPVLVDSIALLDKDPPTPPNPPQQGFNVEILNPRRVRVNITGQLTDDNTPLPDDLEKVSAETFARSSTPPPTPTPSPSP